MKKNKLSKNSIFFNEDKTLESLYLRAKKDGLPFKQTKRENFMNKKWLTGLATLVVAASAVFAISLLNKPDNASIIDVITEKTVIAYVSVDINPSFEISVYDDNTVESIAQLNEDALSIDVTDLIGMDVDLAIEAIVARATDAGFIDTTDILDDYVLVTTVATEESTLQQQDQLHLMIQDRIQTSETLNSVYVVDLKTDLQTKFEADGKNIPVGLYVINGEVLQEDGTYLSVKEVFSNIDKLTELQHTYQFNISDISAQQLTINIQAILVKLSEQGIDVSEYELTLASANIDELHDLHDFLITEYASTLKGIQMNQSDYSNQNENPGTPAENAPKEPQSEPGANTPETNGMPAGSSSPKETSSLNQGGNNN